MKKLILFFVLVAAISGASTIKSDAAMDNCDEYSTVDPDGNEWTQECCTDSSGARTCKPWVQVNT